MSEKRSELWPKDVANWTLFTALNMPKRTAGFQNLTVENNNKFAIHDDDYDFTIVMNL